MSKYNFQTAPNRLSHHTYKWKETETDPQLLPAWIADMDFEVARSEKCDSRLCRTVSLWLYVCE